VMPRQKYAPPRRVGFRSAVFRFGFGMHFSHINRL
jgi:hypothetical protein